MTATSAAAVERAQPALRHLAARRVVRAEKEDAQPVHHNSHICFTADIVADSLLVVQQRGKGMRGIRVDGGLPCVPGRRLTPPLPTQAAADYARLFHALGHETRLQIVRLLAEQTAPLCVRHIESAFGLTQSGISYHLRVLREIDLATTQRRGTWIHYQLNCDRLEPLGSLLAGRLRV
jgi:ArsR family transcriptional regulator